VGIRERSDGLEQLDDRAGPAVRHDQGQGVVVPRLDVDEVDVQAVDVSDELRERVELRLRLAPVVAGRPVADQLLHGLQLYALRTVVNQLLAAPARRSEPSAE